MCFHQVCDQSAWKVKHFSGPDCCPNIIYLYTMLNYEPKILLAFGETFDENGEEFFKWLLDNGYPELAALSSCIKGSKEARDWLMKNKLTHFAAFDGAIDGKADAIEWLSEHDFHFYIVFAEAIHKKAQALKWFRDNNLEMFVHLAGKISGYADRQTFDYHKIHF